MDDVYLEQVRSFGDVQRHPAARVVTIAYCSLINIQQHRLQKDDNELHWHKLSVGYGYGIRPSADPERLP